MLTRTYKSTRQISQAIFPISTAFFVNTKSICGELHVHQIRKKMSSDIIISSSQWSTNYKITR